MKTGGDTAAILQNILAATKYTFTIQAIIKTEKINGSRGELQLEPRSSKTKVTLMSSPQAPSTPILLSEEFNRATLSWNPSHKIAHGAIIKDYIVSYAKENDASMHQSSGNRTYITLTELTPATSYHASVQVIICFASNDHLLQLSLNCKFIILSIYWNNYNY